MARESTAPIKGRTETAAGRVQRRSLSGVAWPVPGVGVGSGGWSAARTQPSPGEHHGSLHGEGGVRCLPSNHSSMLGTLSRRLATSQGSDHGVNGSPGAQSLGLIHRAKTYRPVRTLLTIRYRALWTVRLIDGPHLIGPCLDGTNQGYQGCRQTLGPHAHRNGWGCGGLAPTGGGQLARPWLLASALAGVEGLVSMAAYTMGTCLLS